MIDNINEPAGVSTPVSARYAVDGGTFVQNGRLRGENISLRPAQD